MRDRLESFFGFDRSYVAETVYREPDRGGYLSFELPQRCGQRWTWTTAVVFAAVFVYGLPTLPTVVGGPPYPST